MANLTFVLTKRYDGTFSASWTGGPVELNANNSVIVLKLKEPLYNVTKITTVTDNCDGGNANVYFKKYFKYKLGYGTWTELIDLSQLSGTTFQICESLDLELYYYRVADGNYTTSLYLDNVLVNGKYNMAETDSQAILQNTNDQIILAPEDIYKVFSLSDFQVVSNHSNYEIKYRFTQDNNMTYTTWEDLTTANISTIKLNPLRFAKVQYLITNKGAGLRVYDIVLKGDFQNVSANYIKTNRYGLKQDCLTNIQNLTNVAGSDKLHQNFYTACLGSYNQNTDITQELANQNEENKGKLWNPYQFDKITQFANMLGNQVSDIFGWNVEYHLTDPDNYGIDKYIHEYTLKNVVDMKMIKVVVPENKFPVDHVILNQFNLDLFDSFEIHIMKDEFKNAFGITKRPAQDDIVYICEADMLFYVKHCQQFKSIMNAATYWKVFLEKYEYKTNIRNLVPESIESIKALTDNTTLNSIFGEDMKDQEKKIANKLQTVPTSFDKIRHQISKYVGYTQKKLFIDNFDFITSYYDLSEKLIKNKVALNYNYLDRNLLEGDNRSFIFWVNFKNKYDKDGKINKAVFDAYDISGDKFTFLSNYDTTNKLGYEMSYQGDMFQFKLNSSQYNLSTELLTNIWYAFVINLDQRQKILDMQIYRRNSSITVNLIHPNTFQQAYVETTNLTGLTYYINQGYRGVNNEETSVYSFNENYIGTATGITLVSRKSVPIVPTKFSHEQRLCVNGSDIHFTNLRIFNKEIYDDVTSILKQNIITEAEYLILADNANKQIVTTNLWNKNWK